VKEEDEEDEEDEVNLVVNEGEVDMVNLVVNEGEVDNKKGEYLMVKNLLMIFKILLEGDI